MTVILSQDPLAFLRGGGEMGERIRAFDWRSTPLGPAEEWPRALKVAVRIMLTSRQPIWIGWGRELTYLYNDPYQSIIGGKHPQALGQPASVVWREIWNEIGPMLSTAMSGDEGTYVEEQLLIMERNGYPEETYYTFSYSPIPNDDGSAGGIICANTDDTLRVIGERQLALLQELAARTADARTYREACERSANALGSNPQDLPFAMIYVAEPSARELFLRGSRGIAPGHPAAPAAIGVDPAAVWPVAEVLRTNTAQVVDLPPRLGDSFSPGAWSQSPSKAAVLPIHATGERGRAGALVVGLNPFRLWNDSYQGFLNLVAGQIAASIANAEAYEEEKKRAESLAELDRAKTAFFSNVSHEFRTPLTLMLGPVEDLLTRPADLPPETAAQLEVVSRNGLRLLRLVNTLLDFSRIEAGRVRALYQPTDLASYTAELASVFRSAIERASLQFVVDCPALEIPVFVDREMWEKVVLNLLSNAFKFTLEGGITVILRQIEGQAELRVVDTGTGIPLEEMPRLFERFHRVENAQGRTHEGSGIGLALVQELVRLHGGSVTAESSLGRGTTFIVTLPLGSSHLPSDQVAERSSPVATAAGSAPFVEEALRWLPRGENGEAAEPLVLPEAAEPSAQIAVQEADDRPLVVVADDNADMRHYVARMLSDQYRVVPLADGEAALSQIRQRRPDLVLTDVMMPRLDGIGLVRELRADPRTQGLPIIMLSARAGEDSRVEGIATGADDYLVKPFSARELLARVAAHLQMARMREEAHQSLRAGEERLRLALVAGRMLAWEWDPAEDKVLVSDNVAELYGLPPGTNIVRAEQGFSLVHPDDVEQHRQRVEKAVAECGSYLSQFRLVRPDNGEIIWLEERGKALGDEQGKTARVVGVVMDVTERKRAEETLQRRHTQFKTLLNEAPLGVFLVDGNLSILQLNPTAQLAFEDLPDLIGRDLGEVIRLVWPPQYAEEIVGVFRQTLQTGQPYFVAERAELRIALGVREHYEWHVHRIQLPEGDWGVVCYFRDISAEVLAREAILESEKRLRQAAKMEAIGRLAGGIAHDFNNQLHAIHGFTEFVAEDPGLGARARQDLEEVRKAAERLSGLTRQLLAFSRQQLLQPETIELNAAVIDGRSLLQRLIGSSVEMELELAPDPLWIRADPAQLLQVLMNLSINARDAMPDGGRLLLRTARQRVAQGPVSPEIAGAGDLEPGSYVELAVIDSGGGIAPENLSHVFEPFFTTKDVGHGTGLGLATVHGIVAQSQGHIWVESEPGQGAAFRILLPEAPGKGAEPGGPRRVSIEEFRPARILVVDDDELVRKLVVRTLVSEGYDVLQARNGRQAFEFLDRERGTIDLVVSDVVMPILGGRQYGERLTEEYPDLPIVWMSGYPRDGAFPGRGVAAGQPFLQKPIPADVLISTVRDLVMGRRVSH